MIAVTVTRRQRLDQINEYNQLASVLASIQDEKIVIRRRLNIRIRSRSYKRLKKMQVRVRRRKRNTNSYLI